MGHLDRNGRRTVARAAASAAERYGERVAMRHRDKDEWRERTFAEVGALVDELALGLVGLGLEPGDRTCILANTRPEWTFTSLAISRAGGVVVPIYPTNSPEECEWVAGNSEARMVVCEDASQADKIAHVRDRLERLEHVILMDPGCPGDALSLHDLLEQGRGGADRSELERRCEQASPDDPYTVIYTSGTTGPPKGVVLTHGNCASVGVIDEELGIVTGEDVSYLYLPLAHAYALTLQLATFEVGGSIVYFGGDTKQIVAELQETEPTFLPSVPRIFEKIYALATAAAEDQEKLREAVELGVRVRRMEQRGEEVPEDLRAALSVALMTLDPEEILPWARERGLPDDLPSLVRRDEVREMIQAELDRANAKYARVEQIKKFELLEGDLSQEAGELTPTDKVKRNVVNERYADLFEHMYEAPTR
jgi:long-chain acyl-CoA synthetase